MKKLFVSAVLAAICLTGVSMLSGCNGARDTALQGNLTEAKRGFMHKQLTRGDRKRTYGLFVPTTYKETSKYPVIVFLHGVGEGGSDARANLRVGLAPFVADRQAEFPFICVFPQSESGNWNENSAAATDVIAILDDVLKQYPGADADRVSLTGLSTGGYGTWAIGAKNKERFAALVPMASNGGVDKFASELVNMPIHAYCNAGDMFGGMGLNDRAGVEKIKTMGGTKAEFTEMHDGGHNCWDGVYGSGELFGWLQQQRKSTASVSTPVRATSAVKPAAASTSVVASPAPVRANAGAVVPTPY